MSHPTIDGGHCSEPYLPTEPAELLQSGDYATEVDVLIGEGEGRDKRWSNICVNIDAGFNENESLIGTQFLGWYPRLWDLLRVLWPVGGPYILLQVRAWIRQQFSFSPSSYSIHQFFFLSIFYFLFLKVWKITWS